MTALALGVAMFLEGAGTGQGAGLAVRTLASRVASPVAPGRALELSNQQLAGLSLRTGALATTALNLVGLTLDLPTTPVEVPQDAAFAIPVTLGLGGKPASAAQAASYFPADAILTGTLTGPGWDAPVKVQGTLAGGLSVPGLPKAGTYTISNIRLERAGQILLSARPSLFSVTCLGEILLTQVTSTPMTLAQIKDAGIELQPGDYVGRRFEMVLSVGGNKVSLQVPVAIPVYDGLEDPRQSYGGSPTLQLGNITGSAGLPNLSITSANLSAPSDPFTLSRPGLSYKLNNTFKALLVIPGTIGYLKQVYKMNVVVFNALEETSPYKVTHLTAQWLPPTGLDGLAGTADDPLQPTSGESLTQAMLGPDGTTATIAGGQNAVATFSAIGNREGSHALDFKIAGQFEGGDLTTPIAINGTAHSKVLVQNPNFHLLLVHPDVVRKGEPYTLEAHLTNTSDSKALANAVSITIDKARLGNAELVGDATQQVDTLWPGETAVMKFTIRPFVSGQVTSSYLYIDNGNSIGFQLSAGIGPRNVTLNPDTVTLPDSLNALPESFRAAMLGVVAAAYDVATTHAALPPGVLPISRGTITGTLAGNLSQEGLFLGMGLDRTRIWWDLWQMFMANSDPGFDQLVRTTRQGADLRTALLDLWSTWVGSAQGPAEVLDSLGSFGFGVQNRTLVAIQGAGPGLSLSYQDPAGQEIQGTPGTGLPNLRVFRSAWAASSDASLQFAQCPTTAGVLNKLTLSNASDQAQTLKVAILCPVQNQEAPALSSYDCVVPAGAKVEFSGLGLQSVLRATLAGQNLTPASTLASVPPEPFQVLGVHRYDLSVAGSASPYGTQVMILFNRPNMYLSIADGERGFDQASALIQVEANQFWRKTMSYKLDDSGFLLLDDDGNPIRPDAPPALVQNFSRVVSCYLEKPVGPYVPRTLTLKPGWRDSGQSPLQGRMQWPIASGMLPGGAVVKGRFRKLDGTGVDGHLTYWYQQRDNHLAIDLASNQMFADEDVKFYYALITNNVRTEPDGSFQLDYVPSAIGDYNGPLVLQGNFVGGSAFAQASIVANGAVLGMDLVLEGQGTVDGYVLDAGGQPISGVSVLAIQNQRSSDFMSGREGVGFKVLGLTDDQGHYHLAGLRTGVFSVQALKGELGAVSGGQLEADGQVVHLNLVLQGKVGTLKARVLDAQGQVRMDQAVRLGMPGALMRDTLSPDSWVFPREARPDADGWVTFTNIPAGDVRLQAPYSSPTLAPEWRGFLNPGQTLQVELRMENPAQAATVQAFVLDAQGKPLPGAYLAFQAENAPNFVAVTDATGYTGKVSVAAGKSLNGYIYHPSWVGYVPTNGVVPQPGSNTILAAIMPARCVLSGKVTRPDGTPVAKAFLAIPPVYDDTAKNHLTTTDAGGRYTLPNVATGASFRLACVGPDLLTASNQTVATASGDSALSVDFVLPEVAHNRLEGSILAPLDGNGQHQKTNATVHVIAQLPDISPQHWGNEGWGMPQETLVGAIGENEMPPSAIGQFHFNDLPAGPFTITASSTLFPALVAGSGSFGLDLTRTIKQDLTLQGNQACVLQGRVVMPDGQTPVNPGARVMVQKYGQTLIQVLTQAGGIYAFPKVIPPGRGTLRVEDPVSGLITVQPFDLQPQEVQIQDLRLWGTGNLTVLVQDSRGAILQAGTVTLQHSKSELTAPADMPILALPLQAADQGTLVFPKLLEGPITVQVKAPSGLTGMASATLPVGGGDQTVTVSLQPLGSVKGFLLRANGTAVAAGRVDADQDGRWLGTSPTYQEDTPGEFLFSDLPIGAINLVAWDPDSRQMGRATVQVKANEQTSLTLSTLDTGAVTIQALQEGQPVVRAGLNVTYQGGPALSFTTQATADAQGYATFTLPPGTYRVEATDPVSMAKGSMTFTRNPNDLARNESVAVLPVRSVFLTALPPTPAPGMALLSLRGWSITASGVDRACILDGNNQGALEEMPVGAYTFTLRDPQGHYRGSRSYTVTAPGGALQTTELQALAIGSVLATILDAQGHPVPGANVTCQGGSLFTDQAGQVIFYGRPQGTELVFAHHGASSASASYSLSMEGEQATTTVTFAPTAAVHGLVRDALGHPMPFMQVTCGNLAPAGATDGNGRFAFQGLPLQHTFTIVATSALGRIGLSAPVTLAEGDDPEVDVVIQPVGTLNCRLSDPLRPVLPSLTVRILNGSSQLLATSSTDENGAFQMPGLPAGQELLLQALWDDGRTEAVRQTFQIAGEGQVADLNLTLPAFVNVTGFTWDFAQNNYPMYLELQDAAGNLLGKATTTVDIPTFLFRYLKAGTPLRLVGFDQVSHAAVALNAFTPSGQMLSEDRTLQVAPSPQVIFQLRYPDGTPAPGRGANLSLHGTAGLALGLNWTIGFDASGVARVPTLAPGQLRMTVSRLPWQGDLTQDLSIPMQAGVLPVEVPVRGVGSLSLQVQNEAGRAQNQGQVLLSVAGQNLLGALQNGVYVWPEVPVNAALSLQASGFALGFSTSLAPAALSSHGEARQETLTVPSAGSVQGHLLDVDGLPVADAPVQVFLSSHSFPWDPKVPDAAVTTDATGAYHVGGLPLGQSVRVYTLDAAGDFASTRIRLNQDLEQAQADLHKHGLGSFQANLQRSSGLPLAGAKVTLTQTDAPTLSAVSDAQGVASFSQVPAGMTWTATAALPTRGAIAQDLPVQRGQSSTLTWQDSAFTRLVGPLRRSSGLAFPDGSTLGTPDNSASYLDADGSFGARTLELAPGVQSCSLTLRIHGSIIGSWTVPATIDGDTQLSSVPAFGNLSVSLRRTDGTAIANASLQLNAEGWVTADANGTVLWTDRPLGLYHVMAKSSLGVAEGDLTLAGDGVTAALILTVQPRVTLTVAPLGASLKTNETQTFTATVVGSENTAVTWSVLEGNAGGTINQLGTYTAPNLPGTYHVVASSVVDPSRQATVVVSVAADGNLFIAGTYTTNYGALVLFQKGAQITGTLAISGLPWVNDPKATFKGNLDGFALNGTLALSSNGAILPVAMVFAPDATTFAGTLNTYAWSATRQMGVVSIWLDPQALVIVKPGDQVQYSALVAGAQDTSLTWRSTDASVDGTGLYTAPLTKDNTTQTVTVAANADPSKTQSAQVCISSSGALFISGSYAFPGGNALFYQNGAQITGTLSRYGTDYSFLGTLNGYLLSGTAKRKSDSWSTAIAVTFSPEVTTYSGVWSEMEPKWVGIRQPGVVTMELTPRSSVLRPGGQVQFSAKLAGLQDTSMLWTASAGMVDVNGLFTAPVGQDYTCQTITATAKADPSQAMTAKVYTSPTGTLFISGTYIVDGQGTLLLFQKGNDVSGTFTYGDNVIPLKGVLAGDQFTDTLHPDNALVLQFAPEADALTVIRWGSNSLTWVGHRQLGVVSVQIQPSAAKVLKPGEQLQYSALVAGTLDPTVIWEATQGSVDAQGLYTAPQGQDNTCQAITVRANADLNKSDSAKVSIAPTGFLFISGTYHIPDQLNFLFYQTGNQVTGTISIPNTSTLYQFQGTLNGYQLTGVAENPDYYPVQVALTFNPEATSFSQVFWQNVSQPDWIGVRQLGLITLDFGPQAPAILRPGMQIKYSARVAGAPDASVTWSSSDGSVDASGLYTAPQGQDYSCQTITAVVNADPSQRASAKVSLTPTGVLFISGTYTTPEGTLVIYQRGTEITGTLNNGYQYAFQGSLNGYDLQGHLASGGLRATFSPEVDAFQGSKEGYPGDYPGIRIPGLISVQLSPQTLTTQSVDTSQKFQAQVAGTLNEKVIWTATGGSIVDGSYTPNSTGLQTIRATSVADSRKSASVQVLVTDGHPERNLAARWSFEGGAGDPAQDDTGHGYAGTLLNGAMRVPGRLGTGQALQLNGLNSSMEVADAAALNPASLSVSMWLKLAANPDTDGGDNWRSILHKGTSLNNGGPTGYDVALTDSRRLVWNTGNGVGDMWWPSGANLPIERWSHVVFTYDADNGLKQAFLDGILLDTECVTPGPLAASVGPLQLGVSASGSGGNFDGNLDDVRIYNRALSPSEVAELFGTVKLSPRQVALAPGQQAAFLATQSGPHAGALHWASNGGDIDADGTYHAPQRPGTYQVTVASSLDPSHPDSAQVTVRDFCAGDEFSSAQNPNGPWAYGWTYGLASAFNPFPWADSDQGWEQWVAGEETMARVGHNASTNVYESDGQVQPNQLQLTAGGSGSYAVLSWTAPDAGPYAVTASFAGSSYYSSFSDVHVFLNGASLFDGTIAGYLAGPTFTRSLTFAAGDILDFRVGGDSPDVKATLSATLNRVRPGITVAPAELNLTPGQGRVFVATATGLAVPNVVWSVQEGVAGGTVTQDGSYLAPSVPGLYHIVATSTVDASVLGMATVAVNP